MKLNYQIVITKISGTPRILIADDLGTNDEDIYLAAKDIYGNNYKLLWEINNGKIELFLNDILTMPLYEYIKNNRIYPCYRKNDEVSLTELLNIQQKINSKLNTQEK